MNAPFQPGDLIKYIATVSENIAWQAGVGSMETAGSIVSYLAEHPECIDDFLSGGSVLDWPFGWHAHGCLSWHGQDGKIYRPEFVRRQRVIDDLAKPTPNTQNHSTKGGQGT